MAIRQRGNGWQADVQWKGKREREQCTSESSAKAWEAQALVAMKAGKPVPRAASPGIGAAAGYDTLGSLVETVIATRWQKPGAHQMVSCAKRLVEFIGPLVPPAEALSQSSIDAFLAHTAATRKLTSTTM